MYIFIDESGNFTKHNDEQYFVIASFTVGDHKRTHKAFRSWCRTRFPRKMSTQNEIKWSSSHIDDSLRLRTIKEIANLDVRIRYGFLLRSNIPTKYITKKNKIDSGVLYTSIIGEILEAYFPIRDKEIHIFCDRRSLKGMTKKDFESQIISRLIPLCAPDVLIEVKMIDSAVDANMQIADWIAGALTRYLEKKNCGEEYYSMLKNNFISEGKELFRVIK